MELILSGSLIFIFLVWIKRIVWIRSFSLLYPPLEAVKGSPRGGPRVSVIVPARNEEKNISTCLQYLLHQSYTNYEIIAVDDRSSDSTADLIESHKKYSPVPIRIVPIQKLPPGWTGKNYAMFTGSKAAEGEWFLFTDADTTHQPTSIQTALQYALEKNIDCLTLSPEVECKSFWEKVVQPLASGSLALWFDPKKVNAPQGHLVLANGQFILIKKSVYEKVGGNESVKSAVVEDVELAKKIRRQGYVLQFLNGGRLYATRMYTSLGEIITGWTRILTHLFDKKILPIAHKIFLFTFFSFFPFVVLTAQIFYFNKTLFILSLVVCILIIVMRFMGNRALRTNPWYAFTHPLGSLVMIWILLVCVCRIFFDLPSPWKGERYT